MLGISPPQPAPRARAPVAPYTRRAPELTTLHRILREHLATFLERCRERADGRDLPAFVQRALRRLLGCGVLQQGFCRFSCASCGFDHLVALSCKGRGLCPSCGGRRMTELAARLVDDVIPFVPVRQLVLSLPPRLRYLLAYDHDRCRAVLRFFATEVRRFYHERAHARGVLDGHTGAITFLQRFGSAANLNLHFHMIALDGVFEERSDGTLHFHPAPPPSRDELAALLVTLRARVERWLQATGLLDADTLDPLSDEAPMLALGYATSVAGQSALERPFAPVRRLRRAERAVIRDVHALRAHDDGFDLHAGLRIAAQHAQGREPLERLLRYCARPPIADDRLNVDDDGRVHLALKTPWHDGTTHLDLDPLDFLARCAALIPRPHKNLLVYHGVLAANARLRPRVVQHGRPSLEGAAQHPDELACASVAAVPADSPASRARAARRRSQWADLMRRAFGYDLLTCPRCGDTMALLACILDRASITRVLRHLELPTDPEPLAPARASPNADLWSPEVA